MSNHSLSRYSTIPLLGAAAISYSAFMLVLKTRQLHNSQRNVLENHHMEAQSSFRSILFHLIHSLFSTSSSKAAAKCNDANGTRIRSGGYESLIGNTPLVYLPHLSSLLHNNVKIYLKMENMNPGGTGKDRAARSMILAAERRADLPPPINRSEHETRRDNIMSRSTFDKCDDAESKPGNISANTNIPSDIQAAIQTALRNTQTHGLIIEGTSGSTGISLASISSSRGHGVIVVMPDDQSSQKREYLERLGCGVVVVKNCSISNPSHYVNVAKRIWEWVEVERRFDGWYWASRGDKKIYKSSDSDRVTPRLIKAAFMNQFENLANLQSHYLTTGPEIYEQLDGKVDAFVMSAGTGGTIVGVGGYLKDRWWADNDKSFSKRHSLFPPRIVLVDPPGSSLYNKVKFGVAYASQMSEQRLRRHRYDTLAEGIGLDRITANFGLGCIDISWSKDGGSFQRKVDSSMDENAVTSSCNKTLVHQSRIIDDAISITDQQAVYMAHYLLRHEGIFVGSSTAMNIVGALYAAKDMPSGSNIVTVVCDGGQRHTSRFWSKTFIEEWGLVWPEVKDDTIDSSSTGSDIMKDLFIVEVNHENT